MSTACQNSLNSQNIILPLSAEDPSDGRTWEISLPWDKLQDKYISNDNFLSIEFDLYSARRAAFDPEWCNRIEGADLTATVLMNSSISSWDVDAVLRNRDRIESSLRLIPNDLDLAEADLDSEPLRSNLLKLIAAFRVKGIGIAKVMKTLCVKRPRLLPMLDREVRRALYNLVNFEPEKLSEEPKDFAQSVLHEIGLFKRVLLWNSGTPSANYPHLVRLAGALSKQLAHGDQRISNAVTPVRVLDNLLWFEWHGHKYYGWVENGTDRCVERTS